MKDILKNKLSRLFLAGALTISSSAKCTNTLEDLTKLDCASFVETDGWSPSGLMKVFALRLRYDHGSVINEGINVMSVYYHEKKDQPNNGYHLRVSDSKGDYMFLLRFEFPLKVYDIPGMISLDEADATLFIPYRNDARSLEVYTPSCNQILNISVDDIVDDSQ